MAVEDQITLRGPDARMDRGAAWMLGAPLSVGLGALCLVQIACWAPHYLTWPWWADHDVFATMAQAWSRHELPYRDMKGNNFPGTIYVFWALGTLFGWGRTVPFYAADVALLVGLGVVLFGWSRRRFGRALPGLAGYAAVLTYYLGLGYALTGQRDWHAAVFAVISVLFIQAWPGRSGRVASGLAFAFALAIRPQVALFGPPMVLAIMESDSANGISKVRAIVEWAFIAIVVLGIFFVPLVAAGVFDDFFRSLRAVTYGGGYNRVSLRSCVGEWLRQLATRDVLILSAIGLLMGKMKADERRVATVWALTWACVSLYRPLSPFSHAYLSHPLAIVTAINVAVLVQFLREMPAGSATVRLVAVLLALGLSVVVRPAQVNPRLAIEAVSVLRRGEMPKEAPPGYRPDGAVVFAAYYPWKDYRAVLEYVQTRTSPGTRIANALQGAPAITGPTGQGSAFPAESVAWLFMVNPDEERAFAESLERAEDSIVVWAPSEIGYNPKTGDRFDLERIVPVIRRLYERETTFGVIEVWRRKRTRDALAVEKGSATDSRDE